MALGLFALIFLGAVPQILIARGGPALFLVFGSVMAVAALVVALFFRNPGRPEVAADLAPFSRAVWFLIFGVSLMTFNQAMVLSRSSAGRAALPKRRSWAC